MKARKIEIEAGDPPVKLLSGKIASLEPELDQSSPALVVRGYDLSHALYRGKKRRSFVNVNDADLARQLAQESACVQAKLTIRRGRLTITSTRITRPTLNFCSSGRAGLALNFTSKMMR